MKVIIQNSSLKEICDAVESITNEARFDFDKDGLYIKAIDSARIALVDLKVDKEYFVMYDVNERKEIAMDVSKLKGILRLGSSTENLTLSTGNDEQLKKLIVTIGKIEREMSLLDSVVPPSKLPSITAENYVNIKKSDFERILRAANDVRDAIKLHITFNKFLAEAESSSDKVRYEEKAPDIEISSSGEAVSSYPLDYLVKIIRSISGTERVKISFNSNYPAIIEFPEKEHWSIKYYLAPRME
ncbi:DNA polymerase sliding clamp [Caldiplasma sukawensis]